MAETADLHTKIDQVAGLFGELNGKVDAAVKRYGLDLTGQVQDGEQRYNIAQMSETIADLEVTIEKMRRHRRVAAGEFDDLFTKGTGESDGDEADARSVKADARATKAARWHLAIRDTTEYADAFDNAIRINSQQSKVSPEDEEILRGRKALAQIKAPERIKSVLGSDFASGAGWLAPATMERTIDRLVVEMSPFMTLVSQRPVGSGSYKGLIRNANRETGQNLGQRGQPTATTVENRYIEKTIDVHDHWAEPAVTQDALEDAFVDLEAELTADAAEQFGVEDGRRIWSGTGVKEAVGISTNTAIVRQPSGEAATFGMTAIRQLPFRLTGTYTLNGRYALSRQALILLIGMRENSNGADTGQYLWQPSTQAGTPSLLNSFPWTMMVDMDAVGANTLPVLFADFRQLYRVVVRRGIRVLRDEYTATPYVLFKMSRRWGGDVWKSEAGIFLKCATS